MSWDLTNVEENSFKPIPAGEYLVTATEATVVATKAGNGEYIKLRFKILNTDHRNKILFHTFNMVNPNSEAVKIGMQQLKGYMTSAGFTNFKFNEINDLCGKQVLAVVKLKEDNKYGTQAVISYFRTAQAEVQDIAPF